MTEPARSAWNERVTQVFEEFRASGKSSEELFVQLYLDLKQLARMKLSGQPSGASMHATRLLSDLYVRLFGSESPEFRWESAAHFFNSMALAMHHLLIDHARHSVRRGRGHIDSIDALAAGDMDLSNEMGPNPKWKNLSEENVDRAIFVNELLERLQKDADGTGKEKAVERQAEIVRLRLLLGLSEEEVAAVLGCCSETVTKEFRKAKAKLASFSRS